MNSEYTYMIANPAEYDSTGLGSWEMTHGPTPNINKMLSIVGEEGERIVRGDETGLLLHLLEWDEDIKKWVSI